MCGIVGFIAKGTPSDWAEPLARATRALSHRGPDDEDMLLLPAGDFTVGLGHRRLSILDLSAAGRQPMVTPDGRYALVCNGEIYNAAELRSELEARGRRFRSHSDNEVILHGFAEFGQDFVSRLNGMFAFAVWDNVERRLWIARDRVGIKPLLYRQTADGFVFASELRVLADWPGASRRVDPRALHQYLVFGYTLTPLTLLEGIRKLRPAHLMSHQVGSGRFAERCYWRLADAFRECWRPNGDRRSPETQLIDRLGAAVERHRASDVPLGSFLSGGVDSTVVSALLAERDGEPRTFCADFRESNYSEAREAEAAARSIGVLHERHDMTPPTAGDMQRLVRMADEPFADSSFVAYDQLSAFARRRITVALSGDGADELLAGYVTYRADRYHRYLRMLPLVSRRWMAGSVATAIKPGRTKVGFAFKARQFLQVADADAARAHALWRMLWSPTDVGQMLAPAQVERLDRLASDPVGDVADHFAEVRDLPFLHQALYVDTSTWLLDDILHKVDRASMAHGLEVRVPFLEHPFIEWCAALPAHFKLNGRTGKWLLRRAVRQRFPAVQFQRRKQGFNSPVGHWINHALRGWADELFADARASLGDWFRPDGAHSTCLAEHRSGRADHGYKLWGLLWLLEWRRQVGATL